MPPDFIAAQIDAVFSDLEVGAVKIGMLSNAGAIAAVAAGLDRHKQSNIVLDPVMVATSGDRLLEPDAIEQLRAAAHSERPGADAEPAGGGGAARHRRGRRTRR